MTHRQTRTLSGDTPLKYATGAEVQMDVVVDYTTVTVDSNAQRIVEPGELLCRITASDKWGPYSASATDGRQTVAQPGLSGGRMKVNAVISSERLNVTLGNGVLGGFYHNCVFDKSQITGASEAGTAIETSGLLAAFPNCTFDD